MGITPQIEEFSSSLGQNNSTDTCVLPCSIRLAKRTCSLVLHHVAFNPLLVSTPHNPCAPAVQVPGTHRSPYSFPNLIPATFNSSVIPDLPNRQIVGIYGESRSKPVWRRAVKTKTRCYKPFPWHFLHHGEPVVLSNHYYYLSFARFVCHFRDVLAGQLWK